MIDFWCASSTSSISGSTSPSSPRSVCLLYFRRRAHYTFTRDAILFSGALALISYSLFPVAPPRLLPGAGILDTLQALDNLSYQAQSTQFFVNPYAAMPSLHVGWAILIAIGMFRAFPGNRLVIVFALIHPIVQWSSTVFTGNHYLLDGVGGVVVACLGLTAATFMQRHGYALLSARLGLHHEPIGTTPAKERSAS